MPKVDKDFSLYRTYVIFRTLGLRHLVVVNVHNQVVGLITRKDLMPFKMQERLESLLELTATINDDAKYKTNCDEQRKSADNAEVVYLFADEKRSNSVDSNSSGRDVLLPSSSVKKVSLGGLEEEEEDEADSTTAATAEAADSDSGQKDSVGPVEVVVTVPSQHSKQDWV